MRWTGKQAVVAFPDHVDVSNAGPIREQLLGLVNRGASPLIADMTRTVSCDHAGADALLRVYQRSSMNGTRLRAVVTAPAGILRHAGRAGAIWTGPPDPRVGQDREQVRRTLQILQLPRPLQRRPVESAGKLRPRQQAIRCAGHHARTRDPVPEWPPGLLTERFPLQRYDPLPHRIKADHAVYLPGADPVRNHLRGKHVGTASGSDANPLI